MANFKYLLIFILILINSITCDRKHSIHKRVEELNNKSIEMYGEVIKHNTKRNIYMEDRLMYPRGDKRKLSALSRQWRCYYTCTARSYDVLTVLRQLPSIMMMVYQGSIVRMRCSACVPPEKMGLGWMYAKSTDDTNFTQVEEQERVVSEDENMTIYNVMPEDAGIYWCQVGDSGAGLVIVEVVDVEEPYNVVKPSTSLGPFSVPPEEYKGLTIFSQWSVWSECSVCGKVGRRRRYGMCYVKLDKSLMLNLNSSWEFRRNTERQSKFMDFEQKVIELFSTFPAGIPCRSEYMPPAIKNLDVVQRRTSEIMIALCKVECIKPLYSPNYAVLLVENNHKIETLVYSLREPLPKQPPLPARNTIFAEFGQPITIRCPGTSLRDVPIEWRVGTKRVVPRYLDKESGGRVHLNARDHLVFTAALYSDANLYSCWQWDNLAGTVKLVVWRGARAARRWHGRAVLLAAALLLCLAARPGSPRSPRSPGRPGP